MFQELYMRRIVAAVGVMAVVGLVAYSYYTFKSAQYIYSGPVSISVMGVGEVMAKPDLATFSFTVETKEADAVTAQNKAGDIMDAILAYLDESGVEEKDIKTGYYNLSPRYEYPETVCTSWGCPPTQEPTLIGYQVSQSVEVKVRDNAKAGEILSGVGAQGAQNVSGLSFTIDDEEVLKSEAREKAITDAKEKAQALADALGVRIVRMTGFWEEQGGYSYYGKGGMVSMDMAMNESAVAPRAATIPQGENTVTASVNITYEIR